MEKHLDEIAKKVGKEIKAFLKQQQLYDNNINVHFKVGKYTVLYHRNSQLHSKFEPLINLPIEFFLIFRNCVIEMAELWSEYEENGTITGTYITVDYSIDCIIDNEIDLSGTIDELKTRINSLQKEIAITILDENYEEAARLKKIIDNLQSKIDSVL